MKNLKLLVIALTFLPLIALSQKAIVTKSGEKIDVKVYKAKYEASGLQIKYKSTDNPRVWQKMPFADIYFIQHSPKKARVYQALGKPFYIKNFHAMSEIQLQASIDACHNYNPKGGVFWGSFVPAFIIMPAGLISAIAISSSDPKKINMSDNDLETNLEYFEAYKIQAKKMKQSHTWTGFWTGWALGLAIAALIVGLT